MGLTQDIWADPAEHLRLSQPDHPVIYAAPSVLRGNALRFLVGFPGMVTYAVKANPAEFVLTNLAAAGVEGFDVASPHEMAQVALATPDAVMHYNNPVRSEAEIIASLQHNVVSWAVDAQSELDKLLCYLPQGAEIAVRFKLPVSGAAYDFGSKFGAGPACAAALLRQVARMGYVPAMTFHPGTQCTDPNAWAAYITQAAEIARHAGVDLARLNVGGGFPAHYTRGDSPLLEPIFDTIARSVDTAFGTNAPALVCEPGRAMVAEAFTLSTRIKSIRDGDHVFLNDGLYGGLAEANVIGLTNRIDIIAPDGRRRNGRLVPRVVFGPTCDSIDRLPDTVALPADMREGDYVMFRGAGAYSTATATRFNGYGALEQAIVLSLDCAEVSG